MSKITIFVVFQLLFSFCAVCAMDHGSPPPAPRKNADTPGRASLDAAKNNADTPLTNAERLRDGARKTKRISSRRQCVMCLANKLDDASCSLGTPERDRRFKALVNAGQTLAAGIIILEGEFAGAAGSDERKLDHGWRNSPLKDAFCKFAALGGPLNHVPLKHVMDGDERGGCHFLATDAMRDEFVANTRTALGRCPIENIDTGVMCGVRNVCGKNQPCTVICGFDESAVISLIKNLYTDPSSICSPRSRFGWSSVGRRFPFEAQAQNVGDVSTFYPVLAFVEWQPGLSSICAARLACDGNDCSIYKSSDELLGAAQRVLFTFFGRDRRLWPLHYVDMVKGFLVVDVAPVVSNGAIPFGIYVKMPLALFDVTALKTKYPDLFS